MSWKDLLYDNSRILLSNPVRISDWVSSRETSILGVSYLNLLTRKRNTVKLFKRNSRKIKEIGNNFAHLSKRVQEIGKTFHQKPIGDWSPSEKAELGRLVGELSTEIQVKLSELEEIKEKIQKKLDSNGKAKWSTQKIILVAGMCGVLVGISILAFIIPRLPPL